MLHQILIWGRFWRSTATRGDPHETYLREGERNLALKILTTIYLEPADQPTQQQTKPETEYDR